MHLRQHLPMARRVIGNGVSILIDIICTLSHSHLDVVEFCYCYGGGENRKSRL